MARRFPSGSSDSGTLPEEGSQRRWRANRRISRIAIQKFGMAIPSAVSPETPKSSRPCGRTAARMPRTRASARARPSARTVSSRVTGSRAAITPSTGWLVRKERPQSPRRSRPSQSRYCTYAGRSKPRSWRRRATVAGSASRPSIRTTGSPRIACISRKISAVRKSMAKSIAATRRSTKTGTVRRSGAAQVRRRSCDHHAMPPGPGARGVADQRSSHSSRKRGIRSGIHPQFWTLRPMTANSVV